VRELRVACAVLLVFIGGRARVLTQPATARDVQIDLAITDALNRCDRYTIFDDVAVNVREGVATLSGKVTSASKSREIEKRVRSVSGVTAVRNDIEPLPPSRLDDQLRGEVFDVIYRNRSFLKYGGLERPPIHIIVEAGHVTLSGTVVSDVDRRLAQSLALRVGARSLTNKLRTEAEVRTADAR
jgi:osmotically-inducible protein OsmY